MNGLEMTIKGMIEGRIMDPQVVANLIFWLKASIVIYIGLFILNIISQLLINSRSKNHELKNQKEIIKYSHQKSMIEKLFKSINDLLNSLLVLPNGEEAMSVVIAKVKDIRVEMESGKLYLNKGIEKAINNTLDYILSTLTAPRSKDLRKESELLIKISNEFNKL